MGQYYKPAILTPKGDNAHEQVEAWCDSHNYDNGLKLMEHSYVGNNFVNAFTSLLADEPKRVVWAGDYADGEPNLKLTEDGQILEGEIGEDEYEANIYALCEGDGESGLPTNKTYRYILNHSTNEFVDIEKAPVDNDGWQIHPLPLLTCEGNGRGGGDYHPENDNVGIWARNTISVSNTKPEEMKEFKPNFFMY